MNLKGDWLFLNQQKIIVQSVQVYDEVEKAFISWDEGYLKKKDYIKNILEFLNRIAIGRHSLYRKVSAWKNNYKKYIVISSG